MTRQSRAVFVFLLSVILTWVWSLFPSIFVPPPLSSRPSAQKQASWLYASAEWKSPTRTSRSPRKTSCTRSRRARRRGFTSNLQNFNFITLNSPLPPSLPSLPPSLSIAVWKRGGSSWVVCLPQREFWYILCTSCLALSHSPVTVMCKDKKIKKRTENKRCYSSVFSLFSRTEAASVCRLLHIRLLYIEFVAAL